MRIVNELLLPDADLYRMRLVIAPQLRNDLDSFYCLKGDGRVELGRHALFHRRVVLLYTAGRRSHFRVWISQSGILIPSLTNLFTIILVVLRKN